MRAGSAPPPRAGAGGLRHGESPPTRRWRPPKPERKQTGSQLRQDQRPHDPPQLLTSDRDEKQEYTDAVPRVSAAPDRARNGWNRGESARIMDVCGG